MCQPGRIGEELAKERVRMRRKRKREKEKEKEKEREKEREREDEDTGLGFLKTDLICSGSRDKDTRHAGSERLWGCPV